MGIDFDIVPGLDNLRPAKIEQANRGRPGTYSIVRVHADSTLDKKPYYMTGFALQVIGADADNREIDVRFNYAEQDAVRLGKNDRVKTPFTSFYVSTVSPGSGRYVDLAITLTEEAMFDVERRRPNDIGTVSEVSNLISVDLVDLITRVATLDGLNQARNGYTKKAVSNGKQGAATTVTLATLAGGKTGFLNGASLDGSGDSANHQARLIVTDSADAETASVLELRWRANDPRGGISRSFIPPIPIPAGGKIKIVDSGAGDHAMGGSADYEEQN